MSNEAFDKFWATYPRRVGKGNALRAWEKMVKGMEKSEEEARLNEILLAIDAQKRYRRLAESQPGNFVPDWRHPATWINGMCWEDEIPSHAETVEKGKLHTRTCSRPECNNPVHGPRFEVCGFHLSTEAPAFQSLRDLYKKNGLAKKHEESREEWLQRLRATTKVYMRKISEKYL